MFMFQSNKQKKKDKLWFACQTRFQQYNQDIDVMPSVQPQRRHPQHLLRPQQQYQTAHQLLHQQQQQQQQQHQPLILDPRETPPPQYGQMNFSGRSCCSMSSMLMENSGNNSSSSSNQQLLYPMNTPPQCVCSNSCFGSVADEVSYAMELESGSEEMSIEQDYETKIGGSYCESYGDNSTDCNEGDDYDHQYSNLSAKATRAMIGELNADRLTNWQQNQNLAFHQTSIATTTKTNNKSTGTTIAGSVLRSCCYTAGDSISNESTGSNCHHPPHPNQNFSHNAMAAPSSTTVTSAITATAANVFRNCCRGVGSQSNESSIGNYPELPHQNNRNFALNNNNNSAFGNNNNNKNNFNFYEQKTTASTLLSSDSSGTLKVKELFKALMKKLKDPQLDTLCQVVENRLNAANAGTDANNSGSLSVWRRQNQINRPSHQPSTCVLVPRESIGGEEPNVIACRLWLWPDLRDSTELKRIPMCPNGKEKVYVCCNPAHWNRILIPEAAPPPYQQSVMDRLKPEDRAPSENLKDGGLSTVSSTTTGRRVQIPESFTTNGEDHSSTSPTWCQIAYWELAQRVGDRYEAKNSTVNIYSEGSGGMCLKDLADKKFTATSSSVQKTRQKIGLGITLSQEADGVWLYNRSEAPIFVHSPTLNDDCRHVSKVPPGYCLNAFDINRARTQKLVCSPQIAGAQTGPIDTFSMQISFAKGWGSKYRRTDITACHCWLEVLFARR
ncbi:uncharacterized protein LOC129943441 [Eupeodes corollae]|uniref:uncharacterized protein LOC129943441 n=1 Tax=Eupeodes corollae TaxID=290404 RepID=UPI0024927DC4|nr:uncharacterized protein LOC129943441 [Eupeodes corollae]